MSYPDGVHPPGRRRLRSAVRADGYEFPSGRFTSWVRFVEVDLECEGVLERVGRGSPQQLRLAGA